MHGTQDGIIAYSTLPEAVHGVCESDMLPQVRDPEREKMFVGIDLQRKLVAVEIGDNSELPAGRRPNWFRRQRKRVIVGLAAVALAIIAGIVAGAVVSSTRTRSDK